MVIGISRKSTRPPKAYFDTLMAEYYERADRYVKFYLLHVHRHGDPVVCCNPREEHVVIIGSSNTDFENSRFNGIEDLRKLLTEARPGQKTVLSNTKYDSYDVGALVSAFYDKAAGKPIDSYYEAFLVTMAKVGGHKVSMAKASLANRYEEGLGSRNKEPIHITNRKTGRQEVMLDMTVKRLATIQEIPIITTLEGKFRSPIGFEEFDTLEKLVSHLVDAVFAGSNNNRKCVLCNESFGSIKPGGIPRSKVKGHISRHIFERIYCTESECSYWSKTEGEMASHAKRVHKTAEEKMNAKKHKCDKCGEIFRTQDHLKRHIRNSHDAEAITCDKCGSTLKNKDGLQDHLSRTCPGLPRVMTECPICNIKVWAKKLSVHIRTAHTRSDQVTKFGSIMGIDD
ncbi:hypothetical protein ONS95_009604 [Cadophora gregata]|uniref:uncharacterized protein n=1 Tax=Cadophora gregata TaxID=51156 RepID=UPI0026DD5984|nr:uncharacterized protein ONS95_009604 [Cadophora gregata]KAK0124658.1 hypothetical protein ONS95_009604 [Cadophora gregata]KAK0129481.1 hypothetical protein ONS96_000051 [Cadophora gregata f. sp. sojae]